MPFSRNSELPQEVRSALPSEAQTQFRAVFNSVFDEGASEESAFRQAWAAVKENWKPPEDGDGKWVRKVGARHTQAEFKRIQDIHDGAVFLGATCKGMDEEKRDVSKDDRRPLYVRRNVLNAGELVAWAKSQGLKTTLEPDDLHVTITYSKTPMIWPQPETEKLIITESGDRSVEKLGDKGALVLRFESPTLQRRHSEMREQGASFDFDKFLPHVTLTYNSEDVDAEFIEPFQGEIILGGEIFEDVNENFAEEITEKEVSVIKVDEELGIVFGWAIISKINGEDYYDTQGDHIPEDAMMKAAADFMIHSRTGGNMHRAVKDQVTPRQFVRGDYVEKAGTVVFAFPFTTEIAKTLGVETKYTGLLIGMKISDPQILSKFKSGEYTGFSIGGRRLSDEEVEDA